MESLLDKYSPLSTCKEDSTSLSLRLGAVPLEAWENEVPVLDAIIRETTRLAQPHTAMRRNVGPELYINNKIIPTDAYVVYPFSDVHLDPEIYPDPWRFDPGRKEANHAPFAYLGWGGGKENPSFLSEADAYSFSQEKRPALARV
jgi:sterol 14-demethylase